MSGQQCVKFFLRDGLALVIAGTPLTKEPPSVHWLMNRSSPQLNVDTDPELHYTCLAVFSAKSIFRPELFTMIALLISPLYLGLNAYLFHRIIKWFAAWFPTLRRKKAWIIPILIYAFFALSPLIAFLLPNGEARRAMKLVGNYWLGVLLYLLLAVALADLGRLVFVKLLHMEQLSQPWIHRLVGGLCALAIIAMSVGGVINARIIRTTPYDITINKSAGSITELKVMLIADLHLGYNIGASQMERMVEKINAEDPDLVVIAGDIFDNEWEAVQDPDRIAEILRGIRSRYGVYACYGNHDIDETILAGFTFDWHGAKESSPEMDAFLEQSNIRLLRDESVLIGGEIYLYGRPDAHRPGRGITQRKTAAELTADMDQSKPILVLDHEPDELDELDAAGVDADLCGHTHDGQMFPGNLTIHLFWENPCGYLQKGNMHNIVTSGVGLFGPNMRVGTIAEVCPITIHFTASTQ